MTDQEIMKIMWNKYLGHSPAKKLEDARSHVAYQTFPRETWKKLKYKSRAISSTGKITLKFARDGLKTPIKISISHNRSLQQDTGYLVYEIVSEWLSQDTMFDRSNDLYNLFYEGNHRRASYDGTNALSVLFIEDGMMSLINQVIQLLDGEQDKVRAKKAKYKSERYGRKITEMVDELFGYGVELDEMVDLVRVAYLKKIQNS